MTEGTIRSHRSEVLIAAVAMAALMALTLSIVEALDRLVGPSEPPWMAPLRHVDDELTAKNATEAVRALQQAHLAALGSRRWEGMVAVGDASRRIGQAIGAARVYDARARQAYLVALFRARHTRSLEGVLRVADAFSALGDIEVVAQCLHLARGLLARSPDDTAQARVTALEQQLADRSFASGPFRVEPF